MTNAEKPPVPPPYDIHPEQNVIDKNDEKIDRNRPA